MFDKGGGVIEYLCELLLNVTLPDSEFNQTNKGVLDLEITKIMVYYQNKTN